MSIISTYRPYENDAKGSLRTTVTKGTIDFEEKYWDNLDMSTEGKNIIGKCIGRTEVPKPLENQLFNN